MSEPSTVVFDEWNTYVAESEEMTIFISFDEQMTQEDPPADLAFCARVIIPIQSPNESGGPVSPENERLWDMEDELCALLHKHKIRCRLVGRLTYDGCRELVFQLRDWKSFRPPVGHWIGKQDGYEIDVSEHDGWDFFNENVRPCIEDRIVMSDQRVVDGLIEAGSDPEKEHSLEYVFTGEADGLKQFARTLSKRGYQPLGVLDFDSGQVVLTKRLVLDLGLIVDESISNNRMADDIGVEFDGWGALIVK